MKTFFCFRAVLLISAFQVFSVSAFSQGSLTPPGAPAATMKALDQVEPRTIINSTNTPGDSESLFRITQPGSYYLTGNITGVSSKHGIKIFVPANGPGVTIDLMGFELVGVPGALDGVRVSSGDHNMSIRNGTVRAWPGKGINFGNTSANLIAHVRVTHNGSSGIETGIDSCISNCVADQNFVGITSAYSSIVGCVSSANGSNGIRASDGMVIGCTAQSNGQAGISATNCLVKDCLARSNDSFGIYESGTGSIIHCIASSNDGTGISAGNASTVAQCTTYSNGQHGIETGDRCTVNGCVSNASGFDGIRIGSRCQVTDNTCDGNGTAGLFAGIFTQGDKNRIEGNQVTSNDAGISVTGAGHVIVRNSAMGNTAANYTYPGSGIFVGTIVTTNAAMNSSTNSLINISL